MGGKGSGRKAKNEKKASIADKKSNNSSSNLSVINVGDVGYTFRKQFDDGWYTGKVVKIRAGAEGGYDRRCHYEDGDSEDLSLAQLRTLALLDPEVTKKQAKSTKREAPKPADSSDENLPSSSHKTIYKNKKNGEYSEKNTTITAKYKGPKPTDSSDGDDLPLSRHRSIYKKSGEYSNKKTTTVTKHEAPRPADSSDGEDLPEPRHRSIYKKSGEIIMKKKAKSTAKHEPSNCSNKDSELNDKITHDANFKSEDTAEKPYEAGAPASQSKGGGSDGIRRSGRSVKAPRKVDEIYSYEHIKLSYANYCTKKKARVDKPSTPEKKAQLLSSTLDEIIPLDKAAESTLNDKAENSGDMRSERIETDDTGEEEDEDNWLEKVAVSLGADASALPLRKSFRPMHRSSTPSSNEGPPVNTITCTSENNPEKLAKSDCDMTKQPPETVFASPEVASFAPLPLLSEHGVGNRHGCLVFHRNDSRRKLGEVIFEKDCHWVEVALDGVLKSYRASHLRVVPSDQFKEGATVPSNFGKTPRRGSSPGKKLRAKSPTPSLGGKNPPSLSVDYLFCWFCETCGADNRMLTSACHMCNTRKTHKSKRSVLLEIAEKSIEIGDVNSVEEAMSVIPMACRPSIPESLIAHLLKAKTSGFDISAYTLEPKDYSLEHKFYWCCGSCTMQNSYKRTTCSACLQGKGELAERSPLLRIAEEAATNSKTIDEALSLVCERSRPLMPKVVMDALVTCVFMIEGRTGQSRRCRKQKKEGYDFCEAHCDPILLSQPRADSQKGGSIGSPSCNGSLSQAWTGSKVGPRSRIAAISDIMPSFLREIQKNQVNGLEWTIDSIEDSVLCGENAAFPLGMKRPILVYRLKYNDGDQEDFLHHEISSLREIYDKCNVPPEAPPEVQIQPGTQFETRFGTMKIIRHKTPPGAINEEEGGRVIIRFQDSSKDVELDLLKLQLAVLRKLRDASPVNYSPTEPVSLSSQEGANKAAAKPILEWPGRGPKKNDDESIEEEDDERYDVCEGLYLHRRRCSDSSRSPGRSVAQYATTISAIDNPCDVRPGCNVAVNNLCDVRPGCNVGMWDPAGCFGHLSWDPYASTVCEICGIDKDDNRVVICDECHSGFHTYCLRPVMVNIPNDEWICAACCGRSNTQISFEDYSDNLRSKHYDILKYLGLHKKYKNPGEFLSANSDAVSLFSLHSQNAVKQRAISQHVQAKHVVFDVGNLKFIRAPEKNDWRLPTPLLSEEVYTSSILSMAAAMKYCGMKSYTMDHIYTGNVNEAMNDPALEIDEITPMSKRNISIFQAYRHNTREGVFPPVQIIHDENFGFSVKALTCMPRHTIIGEYLGEVVTMEQSSQSNSDSLMVLLDTGDPKTSLIIDPTRAGNIARFLSGINNRSLMSKRKVNVRTRRFFMDGKVHICLFTSRQVEAGEILNYDYNAGNEGKDVDQWARTGFYDTSNFF